MVSKRRFIMENVYDLAKFFVKTNLDIQQSNFDSNMKLQKLLLFAYLINLSLYNSPLYKDNIFAFKQGCVIGDVRLKFKDNFNTFLKDSLAFKPNFSKETDKVLELTNEIFSHYSAKELSELNHTFNFWNDTYKKSSKTNPGDAVIPTELIKKEIDKTYKVISTYENRDKEEVYEVINGVRFYYNPKEITLTDKDYDKLYDLSLVTDEVAMSLFLDDGEVQAY